MAELALGPGTKANAKIVEGFSVLLTALGQTEARVEAGEATVIKYLTMSDSSSGFKCARSRISATLGGQSSGLICDGSSGRWQPEQRLK